MQIEDLKVKYDHVEGELLQEEEENKQLKGMLCFIEETINEQNQVIEELEK